MESVLKNDLIDVLVLAIFCLLHVSWAKRRFCEGMFETDELYFISMDIYNNERLWN
jgi:chromosome condensin MukBEF MukE localization factor